ncbi:hypothetical protein V6N13_107177 [Hibiscus sabdariffa]
MKNRRTRRTGDLGIAAWRMAAHGEVKWHQFFLDWFRNLRIVLKQERKEYVIEEPVPDEPAANAPRADKDKFKRHIDDMVDVGCLMLATMNFELQKQHENMVAYEMIQNLKEIYEGQAR